MWKQLGRLGLWSLWLWALGCSGSDDAKGGSDQGPGVVAPVVPMVPTAGAGAMPGVTAVPPSPTGTGTGGTASGGTGGLVADAGMPPAMTSDAGKSPIGVAGSGAMAACAAAPAGTAAEAAAALAEVNRLRLAAGSGCATLSPQLTTAAQAHCTYYAANTGMCIASPHNEVMGCTGFTGEGPGNRTMAAGYTGRGGSEVMAFSDNAIAAITMWLNSVWHRLPILDPWTTELGYGHAAKCDTIDFGRGTPAPEDTVVVYPYDGQIDVPTSFDGSREGPMPPAPTTGWPSALPITVYAQMMTVTEHVLTIDGNTTPIEHVWLTSVESSFLRNAIMLYANAPFAPQTTYRVKITGTHVGGPLALEWTFKTGDAPRSGRP